MTSTSDTPLGRRVRRNEDPRLLTGRALFVDDVELAGMTHAAFVRSPHAHARLGRIDTSAALAMDGVLAVITAGDLGDYWQPGPLLVHPPPVENAVFHERTQVPLAKEKVRHLGEPVAVVVAESRALSEDAAERVRVDYETLPAVVDIERALDEGASLVHEDVGSNVAAHIVQAKGEYESASADAHTIVRRRLDYDRGASAAIENRGVVADWDARAGRMTVWDTTQAPIPIRGGLAAMLGLNESQVRVVAPFIGGGFGPKIMMFYPEEVVIPWLAREIGRPVKWIEDRSENFLATTQERGQVHEAELALDANGRILGFKDSFLHDTGAYDPYGLTVPLNSQCTALGPYDVPAYASEFRAVFTNKIYVTPYRGAGRQHGVFVIERLLDFAADELGLDRVEIRRRNFLRPDQFPHDHEILYQDFAPLYYDSGNYEPILDKALEMIGYREFVDVEQPQLREEGRHVGIGVVAYVEGTGIGPYEGARVQVHSDGKISVATGVGTQGQGHFTVLAQVAAEQLGVAVSDIHVVTGDTDQFHWGSGTFASRGAVVAGNAVHAAAKEVRQKALAIASGVLEVPESELELIAGTVRVAADPDRAVTLGRLAADANPLRGTVEPGTEPGLEATSYFGPYRGATASGVHAMIVEVDPETMQLDVRRYVVVHDCGKVLNPLIVDGQVHGGVAQGIGNAWYEELVFDDNGQLLNASLMDFLLPTALDVPRVDVGHLETPSPLNELGSKGAGEAGAIPAAALFAQALENALAVPGLEIREIPLGPNRLWELTRKARGEEPTPRAAVTEEERSVPGGGRAMRLTGEYLFSTDRDIVWQSLLDPQVLSRVLPGCERLERVRDDRFEGLLSVQIGPVKGRFEGSLGLSDLRPGEGYHLRLEGQGPAGFLSGEGDVRLTDAEGGTRLTYDLESQVGGTLAAVGQRLLDSSARAIASIGLEGLAAQIEARAAGNEVEPSAAPTAAEVSRRVAGEVAKDLVPRGWLVAAGLAVVALALLAIRACGG
jgi:carbon-monoxide dehydrogenase large subunit